MRFGHAGVWWVLVISLSGLANGQECRPLRASAHGRVSHKRQLVGSITLLLAEFRCNRGYRLHGRADLICFENRWNGPPPVCRTVTGSEGPASQPRQLESGGIRPVIAPLSVSDWIQNLGNGCFKVACSVKGRPPPNVRWYMNSRLVNLNRDPDLKILRDGSLEVCNVRVDSHAGTYRCEARNQHGSAYREITVTRENSILNELSRWHERGGRERSRNPPTPREIVTASQRRPQIVFLPVSEWVTRIPRNCFQVICQVVGAPAPILAWSLNGKKLNFFLNSDFSQLDDGSLKVCNANPDRHAGTYRCDARNEFGSAYRAIAVSRDHEVFSGVITPTRPTTLAPNRGSAPRIIKRPAEKWVQLLSNTCFRILCEVQGDPEPSVGWTFNGSRIPSNLERDFAPTRSGLRVCKASPEVHTGLYRCEAQNSHGSTYRQLEIKRSHPIWRDITLPPRGPLPPPSQDPVSPPPRYSLRPLTPSLLVPSRGQPPSIDPRNVLEWVRAASRDCIIFACEVRGSPRPVVRWFLDNERVHANRDPNYALLSSGNLRACQVSTETHVGNWKCSATNNHGSSTREIFVSADHPVWSELINFGGRNPLIQSYPTVPSNPTERTNTAAQSNPTVQQGIPSSIEFVPPSEQVKVSRLCCIDLACRADGQPRPSVSWFRNDRRIAYWIAGAERYRMQRDGSMRICEVSPSADVASYRCEVRNRLAAVERTINIGHNHQVWTELAGQCQSVPDTTIVKGSPSPDLPQFDDSAEPIVDLSNGCVRLLCGVKESRTPPTIAWYHNNKVVTGRRADVSFHSDGSIEICDLDAKKHAGSYLCRASNAGGHIEREIMLLATHAVFNHTKETPTPLTKEIPTPLGPPKLLDVDTSTLVTMMDNGCLRIACHVSGNPKPNITWTWDNVTITTGPSLDYSLLSDGSLSICYIDSVSQSGTYKCHARNQFGSTSRTVKVAEDHPVFPPDIGPSSGEEPTTEPPASPAAVVRQRASIADALPILWIQALNKCLLLLCSAEGNPAPRVSWFLNDELLDTVSSRDYTQLDDGSLEICHVKASSHLGTYRCEATNALGSASRRILVRKENPSVLQLIGLESIAPEMSTCTTEQPFSRQNSANNNQAAGISADVPCKRELSEIVCLLAQVRILKVQLEQEERKVNMLRSELTKVKAERQTLRAEVANKTQEIGEWSKRAQQVKELFGVCEK